MSIPRFGTLPAAFQHTASIDPVADLLEAAAPTSISMPPGVPCAAMMSRP
ncbi:hypothetical protein [Nocardia sp. NPDC058480]